MSSISAERDTVRRFLCWFSRVFAAFLCHDASGFDTGNRPPDKISRAWPPNTVVASQGGDTMATP